MKDQMDQEKNTGRQEEETMKNSQIGKRTITRRNRDEKGRKTLKGKNE